LAILLETGGNEDEVVEGGGVACNRHDMLSSSEKLCLPRGYFPLLELDFEPCPDLDLFHPSFAPIFFQPLPSPRVFFGLAPGDIPMKPLPEVGGVVGGVIGSRPELEGELALSSVSPLASCISEDGVVD
jgi:hypothetical protein